MWLDLVVMASMSLGSLAVVLMAQSKKPGEGYNRPQATRVPRNTTIK